MKFAIAIAAALAAASLPAAVLAQAAPADAMSASHDAMAPGKDAMATHDAMASHDAMSPHAMTKVPAADMKKINQCKAMKADAMAKSTMCTKMAKLYPAAFSGSASTN